MAARLIAFDGAVCPQVLRIVYTQARWARRPVVRADAVLAVLGQTLPYLYDSMKKIFVAWRPGSDAHMSDPAPSGPVTGHVESVRDIREAQWSFTARQRETPPPAWHPEVLAALDAAVGDARAGGAVPVTAVHLLLVLLRDPPDSVRQQLNVAGLEPAALVELIEPHRTDPGRFSTPSISDLKLYGARPDAVRRGLRWPSRMLTAIMRRNAGWHGGLLPVFTDEMQRQAVRCGAAAAEPEHLLLALASVHWQLRYASVSLSEQFTQPLRGGDVLVDRGAGYPDLLAAIGERDAVVGPPAPSRLPVAEAVDALVDRAVALAEGCGDPVVGSLHLLRAIVEAGDPRVTALLERSGVRPGDLAADLDEAERRTGDG